MTAINNSECKARAKAVMNQTSPTIFIAALIGIGIPILIGWLTEGSAELSDIFDGLRDLEHHDLPNLLHFLRQQTLVIFGTIYALMMWVAGIFGGWISAIFKYGFTDYTLRTIRGELGEPKNTLIGFRIPGRIIIAHILRSIIEWLGTLCFFVPGILASYSLRMTERVMIDHPEWTVVQCMQYSHDLMRGHRMALFGLDLSFFGWIALATITRQLSGIYSGPYRYMAEGFFYERLQ